MRVWDTWIMPLAARLSSREHLKVRDIIQPVMKRGKKNNPYRVGFMLHQTWDQARIYGGSKRPLTTEDELSPPPLYMQAPLYKYQLYDIHSQASVGKLLARDMVSF